MSSSVQTVEPSAGSRAAKPHKDFDRPRFLRVLMGLFLIWTFAPIAIVILFSFNSGKSLQNFDGFSTQWYSDFFDDQLLRESLVASLEIALATMVVATLLGSLLAFGLVRSRNRLSPVTNVMMLIPLVVPEIVAGVSALLLFTQISLRLSLTWRRACSPSRSASTTSCSHSSPPGRRSSRCPCGSTRRSDSG
jgi:spermidine/putrescine transport system permease protein